jgi:hypothetical protein
LAGLAGWGVKAGSHTAPVRWLLCFVLPVLVFILGQAILSRAHANWAATAYPGASLLVAAWFAGRPRLIWLSLVVNGLLAVFFLGMTLLAPSQTKAVGLDNALKRTRGWDLAAEQVFAEAGRLGATSVLVDEREAWHGLDYYARDRALPLYSWRRYAGPKSFSEREALEGRSAERVLVASLRPGLRPKLRSDFASFEPVGQIRIVLGERGNGCPITRVFQLYIASGYAPAERTPEWESAFADETEFAEPPCPPRG